MRYIKFICFYFLAAVTFNACNSENEYSDRKELPIKTEYPVYVFERMPKSEEQQATFQKVNIINSQESLLNLFEIWEFEIPEELQHINYEKNTLLLGFNIAYKHDFSIQHTYFRLDSESHYSCDYMYSQSLIYGSSEDSNLEDFKLYNYYSGILVNKIPDNVCVIFGGTSGQ
jgi:hypothetical protein